MNYCGLYLRGLLLCRVVCGGGVFLGLCAILLRIDFVMKAVSLVVLVFI